MLFAALTLGATLVIARLQRRIEAAGDSAGTTPLLVVLGVVLGLSALTRNEALWLALVWLVFAWRLRLSRSDRLRLVVIPAAVALAFFVPWMVRDWLAFGSPLPGQALTNALSIDGTDIFAWQDPPTVSRYLSVGVGRLVEMRAVGITHNLFDVLLIPGAPLSVIGLVALPWLLRTRALQPLIAVSALIFLVTSLLFPVSTTWGTFLHAAGAVHVLLAISALLALDRLIVEVGRRRGWTRPVAWLAPALTLSGALLFSAMLLPSFGSGSVGTERTFAALERTMIADGIGTDGRMNAPVITDYTIWLSYVTHGPAVALPFESPASVLDLADRFRARDVVVIGRDHPFPKRVAAGEPGAECFAPVDIRSGATPEDAPAIADVRVYRLVCP